MEDLDDFFAKKLKKKTKPQKFSPDELAKKLEQAEKKQVQRYKKEELKRKQERDEQQLLVGVVSVKQGDDEWEEEVEEEVDLSDLNIQQLEIKSDQRREQQTDKSIEKSVTRTPAGPWCKVSSTSATASDDDDDNNAPPPAPPSAASTAATPAAAAADAPAPATPQQQPALYVPLHKRRQMATPSGAGGAGGGLTPVRMGARSSRRAPDINSSEAFPTLGTAGQDDSGGRYSGAASSAGFSARSDEGFRQVRYGGSSGSGQDQRHQQSSVTLGNQFDSLKLNDAS